MKPSLVYLHIPKAAGTTHRGYLGRVYGKENVFWYGRDSLALQFDYDEVRAAPVIGGHRALDFYPRSFKALYTSIVRDPVERVVSFFNYCSAASRDSSGKLEKAQMEALDIWRKRGLDPSSMVRSIEECKEFRCEITNYQCRYLSRHGSTFKGVRRTLASEDMIVGVVDQLHLFDEFFQSELEFPIIQDQRKVNVGDTGYSATILAEPGLVELIRSLNSEDQRLYDFVRFECRGLYRSPVISPELIQDVATTRRASTKSSPTLPQDIGAARHTNSRTANSPTTNWNNIHVYTRGLLHFNVAKPTRITLVILNRTKEDLLFSSEEGGTCAIGWEFQERSGRYIDTLRGIARTDQIIYRGESKLVHVNLDVDENQLDGQTPYCVEFSIVHNDKWMREDYPLNSAWTMLYTEKTETSE